MKVKYLVTKDLSMVLWHSSSISEARLEYVLHLSSVMQCVLILDCRLYCLSILDSGLIEIFGIGVLSCSLNSMYKLFELVTRVFKNLLKQFFTVLSEDFLCLKHEKWLNLVVTHQVKIK